jgi:hypothetical protein
VYITVQSFGMHQISACERKKYCVSANGDIFLPLGKSMELF